MNSFTLIRTIALKFLLSRGTGKSTSASRGFISFISWVAILGVVLGVVALIVVTSVINGYKAGLSEAIAGLNGEVVLYSRADPISDPEKVEEKIRSILPETQYASPSFIVELMALGPDGVAGGILEGISLDREKSVTSLSRRIVEGRMIDAVAPAEAEDFSNEVVLAFDLAQKIGARVGSQVRLTVPYMGDGTGGASDAGGPRVLEMKVVGILRLGNYDYDSKYLFTRLESVQKFLRMPGRVTTFKLRLKPGSDSREAALRLGDAFGYPFRAKDWSMLNKNLFQAIEIEKVVLSIILTAIIIVAAFNVISTLMMMMHDKSREISILKAMGFTPLKSFSLFLVLGLGIGFAGVAIGVLGGVGLAELVGRLKLIEIPAQIYYLDHLPVLIRWSEVGLIVGVTLLIVLGATLYPAIRVARRAVLEGIRYD